MATIYLMFNEGHTATAGTELVRPALTSEAIRLGRLLSQLLPTEPEIAGLLALMLLTESRRPARIRTDGSPTRLAHQDRTLWDRALISEGHQLVRECLTRNEPGPYQIQAAIAAVHADALTAESTDWAQIVQLYDQLLAQGSDEIVMLNRAIAIGERSGHEQGLAALEQVDLENHHLFHAARAELLAGVGRDLEAVLAMDRAIELTSNESELLHLSERRSELAK